MSRKSRQERSENTDRIKVLPTSGDCTGLQGVVATCPKAVPTIEIDEPRAVLVKRPFQLRAHRLAVRLGARIEGSGNFDGTAKLECAKTERIRLYDRPRGGEVIPLPCEFTDARDLGAGRTLYLEAATASAKADDIELKLSLTAGPSCRVGRPQMARAKATCVDAELVLHDPDGASMSNDKKYGDGRVLVVQNRAGERKRAKLIARCGPRSFKGELQLAARTGSVELFAAAEGGRAVAVPQRLSAKKEKVFFVQGKRASRSGKDSGYRLRIKDLPVDADRAVVTVIDARLTLHRIKAMGGAALSPLARTDPGAVVRCKNSDGSQERAKLIVSKNPRSAPGKLVLKQTGGRLDAFPAPNERPTSGESALALPKKLGTVDFPRSELTYWIEGARLSGALRDAALELEVEDAKETVDKVLATVVDIRAEDGVKKAPHLLPVKNDITGAPANVHKAKLKFVPDLGSGSYLWSTTSSKFTLTGRTRRTATLVAKEQPSGSALAETIELQFTPTGKRALPKIPHKLGIVQLLFSKDRFNWGGYDKYEPIASQDQNDSAVTEGTDLKYDFVSVEKSSEGKVKYTTKGADAKDIFFTSDGASVATPKVEQPISTSGTLAIVAKAKNKHETVLNARIGSKTGPIIAKLGVVVLKKVTYEAELFRVKDSASAGTRLNLRTVTGARLTTQCGLFYKQGVAKLAISGGTAEKSLKYDSTRNKSVKNGALDLEPGKTSEEEKIIKTGCASTKARLIYVHKLRWSYFLRANAARGATTLKITKYGATYLGYIGTNKYTIEDVDGNREEVTVTAVDKTNAEITIRTGLSRAFTTAKKTALLWPLGGLSGDPVWVSDVGSEADLANYAAHELGHQLAGWNDVCEVNNVMFGGSTTGTKLRHRPLKKYYDTSKTEKQLMKMKKR